MSTLRSRQQRRKAERSPGLLNNILRREHEDRPTLEHGVRDQFDLNWRYVSGAIVIILLIVLGVFFLTDLFYVRTITVGGANYLDESEIFRYAEVAEMHIFWVDPEEVRRNIIDGSNVIADARVTIGWPPTMVKIIVDEREPQVIWEQASVIALVDLQGNVMQRFPAPGGENLPDLIHVVAEVAAGEAPPGVDAPIPASAVTGALQMRQLGWQSSLRYHPVYGLGFAEPGGWDVWLGVGTNMPNKLLIYESLRDSLLAQGITPAVINVADPLGVYYCGGSEDCYE